MKITITISCDNAAFAHEPLAEVARILDELAEKMRRDFAGRDSRMAGLPLRDVNGNNVGQVKVTGR